MAEGYILWCPRASPGFDGWLQIIREEFETEDQAIDGEKARLRTIGRSKRRKLESCGVNVEAIKLGFDCGMVYNSPDEGEEPLWAIDHFKDKMLEFVASDAELVDRLLQHQRAVHGMEPLRRTGDRADAYGASGDGASGDGTYAAGDSAYAAGDCSDPSDSFDLDVHHFQHHLYSGASSSSSLSPEGETCQGRGSPETSESAHSSRSSASPLAPDVSHSASVDATIIGSSFINPSFAPIGAAEEPPRRQPTSSVLGPNAMTSSTSLHTSAAQHIQRTWQRRAINAQSRAPSEPTAAAPSSPAIPGRTNSFSVRGTQQAMPDVPQPQTMAAATRTHQLPSSEPSFAQDTRSRASSQSEHIPFAASGAVPLALLGDAVAEVARGGTPVAAATATSERKAVVKRASDPSADLAATVQHCAELEAADAARVTSTGLQWHARC